MPSITETAHPRDVQDEGNEATSTEEGVAEDQPATTPEASPVEEQEGAPVPVPKKLKFPVRSGGKSKSVTGSLRAGLKFPVGRLHTKLKKLTRDRVSRGAAVYLAAVLEYLVAEVVEIGGNATKDSKHSRMTPRYIKMAIDNDDELEMVLRGVTFPGCSVVPNIHPSLLPKRKQKAAIAQAGGSDE